MQGFEQFDFNHFFWEEKKNNKVVRLNFKLFLLCGAHFEIPVLNSGKPISFFSAQKRKKLRDL